MSINKEKIIKEINDIAKEVKFLSINAHIEASKATGEAGKRFSVVSQEMTKVSKKLDTSLKHLEQTLGE